jgi:hypothetical protein
MASTASSSSGFNGETAVVLLFIARVFSPSRPGSLAPGPLRPLRRDHRRHLPFPLPSQDQVLPLSNPVSSYSFLDTLARVFNRKLGVFLMILEVKIDVGV